MAEKAIGQFIAAQRKANRMTQQEVAERLNVSNKAISRWERDEGFPDMESIIALAELFGISCDELLMGEKTQKPAEEQAQRAQEKAVRETEAAVSIAQTCGFMNLCWVSLALSLIGLFCMLAITYGFFRPFIGFMVMLVFETLAFMLTAIAASRMKAACAGKAPDGHTGWLYAVFSFAGYYTAFSVVALMLPLVLEKEFFVRRTAEFTDYTVHFFLPVLLLLTGGAFFLYDRYIRKDQSRASWYEKKLAAVQLLCPAAASCCLILAPYFVTENRQGGFWYRGMQGIGVLFLAAAVLWPVFFVIRHRSQWRRLALPGAIRLFGVAVVGRFWYFHEIWYSPMDELPNADTVYAKMELWNFKYLIEAALLIALIGTICRVIRIFGRSRYFLPVYFACFFLLLGTAVRGAGRDKLIFLEEYLYCDVVEYQDEMVFEIGYLYKGKKPDIRFVGFDNERANEIFKKMEDVTPEEWKGKKYNGYQAARMEFRFDAAALPAESRIQIKSLTLSVNGKKTTLERVGEVILRKPSDYDKTNLYVRQPWNETPKLFYSHGNRKISDICCALTPNQNGKATVGSLEFSDYLEAVDTRVFVNDVEVGSVYESFPLKLEQGRRLQIAADVTADGYCAFSDFYVNVLLSYLDENQTERILKDRICIRGVEDEEDLAGFISYVLRTRSGSRYREEQDLLVIRRK